MIADSVRTLTIYIGGAIGLTYGVADSDEQTGSLMHEWVTLEANELVASRHVRDGSYLDKLALCGHAQPLTIRSPLALIFATSSMKYAI